VTSEGERRPTRSSRSVPRVLAASPGGRWLLLAMAASLVPGLVAIGMYVALFFESARGARFVETVFAVWAIAVAVCIGLRPTRTPRADAAFAGFEFGCAFAFAAQSVFVELRPHEGAGSIENWLRDWYAGVTGWVIHSAALSAVVMLVARGVKRLFPRGVDSSVRASE